MGWSLALFIVLGLITLIGHGIWVLISKLFSPGRADPDLLILPKQEDTDTSDLQVTERQISRLHESGIIDDTTYRNVVDAILTEKNRSLPPVPVPPPLPREAVISPYRSPTPESPVQTPPRLPEILAPRIPVALSYPDFLRNAAHQCVITGTGLRASYPNGIRAELSWNEIAAISVRQLPPHPPWEAKLVLDLSGSPEGKPSIRILTIITYVNYTALPGGAASSSRENFQRLATHISSINPSIQMDEQTRAFLVSGKPSRLHSVNQVAEYDSAIAKAACAPSPVVISPSVEVTERFAAPAWLQQAPPSPAATPVPTPPTPAPEKPAVTEPAMAPIPRVPPPRDYFEQPPPPHKPFAEVVASFMEEKNIRWGELIGGLLIVCCSTALVVSLWSQISRIPLLKFAIFTGMSVAFFGAGLYTEHRWKLPTTSRGLLIIAALLVPLNFLAITAFSQDRAIGNVAIIALEALSLTLFFYLTLLAGKVLVPQWSSLLSAGVLGPSASMLLTRALVAEESAVAVQLLLAAWPVLVYCLCQALALKRANAWKTIERRESSAVLIQLGILTFACGLALALLLYKTGNAAIAARHVSPLISLAALPALAGGLFLTRRITSAEMSGTRTAAISIAVVGTLILCAAVILAWPNPSTVFPSAMLNFLALTVVAVLIELPALHLLAGAFLTAAFLFACVALQTGWNPNSPELMIRALFSAQSGVFLGPLFVMLTATAEVLTRYAKRKEAFHYRILAISVAAVSLLLVTEHGFLHRGDPDHVTWVYALYAGSAFWFAVRMHKKTLGWVGTVLLFAAVAQFAMKLEVRHPWLVIFLCYAGMTTAGALLVKDASAQTRDAVGQPVRGFTLPSSLAAAMILLFTIPQLESMDAAGYAFCLAAVWVFQACEFTSPVLFAGFQGSLMASVAFAVITVISQRPWYENSPNPALEPWTVQSIAIALMLLCLGFVLLRLTFRKSREKKEAILANLLFPTWPTVDSIVTALMLACFLWLGCQGIIPGLIAEVTPAPFSESLNLAGVPHGHALGSGSWLLLGVILIWLLLLQWVRFSRTALLGMVFLGSGACALLAGLSEGSNAVASALRWHYAGFLTFVSLLLWSRKSLVRICSPLGWPEMDSRSTGLSSSVRALLIFLTVTPVLFLTLYSAAAAIVKLPVTDPQQGSFFYSIGDTLSFGVPLAALTLVMIGHAFREESSGYAFSGGLFLNLTLTLGFLLHLSSSGGVLNAIQWIRLAQLNIVACAIYAMGWLYTIRKTTPDAAAALLNIQVFLPVLGNVLLLAPAAWIFLVEPLHPHTTFVELGAFWGWLALLTGFAASTWLQMHRNTPLSGRFVCTLFASAGLLLSFGSSGSGAEWTAYRCMLLSFVAASWLTFLSAAVLVSGSRNTLRRPTLQRLFDAKLLPDSAVRWASTAGVITVLFAIRALEDTGNLWWSVGSIAAIAAVFTAISFWTQQGTYLLPGGLFLHLAVTIAWAIKHGPITTTTFIPLIQVNIFASAAFALACSIFSNRIGNAADHLAKQVRFWLVTNLAIIVLAAVRFYFEPASPPYFVSDTGSLLGWMALLLIIAASMRVAILNQQKISLADVLLLSYTLAVMATFSICRKTGTGWSAYHFILSAMTVVPWLFFALVVRRSQVPGWIDTAITEQRLAKYNTWLILIAVAWALRGVVEDPEKPWWSAGAITAMALLAAWTASKARSRVHVLMSIVLWNLAASLWWCTLWWKPGGFLEVTELNALALALAGLAWFTWERTTPQNKTDRLWPSFCSHVAVLCVAILTFTVTIRLVTDFTGRSVHTNSALSFLALLGTAIYLISTLWESEAKHSTSSLSVLGLVAAGMILDQFDFSAHRLLWGFTMIAAVYSFGLSYLWKMRSRVSEISRRMRLPDHADTADSTWLHQGVVLLTVFVLLSSLIEVWNYAEAPLRLFAAMALLLQAGSVALLVQGGKHTAYALVALVLGCFGAIAGGWSLQSPEVSLPSRLAVGLIVLAVTIRIYGFKLIRRAPESEWSQAARTLEPWLAGSYVTVLLMVLSSEIIHYRQSGAAGAETPTIAVVAASILDMLVTSILFAVVPGRDPLGLTETGRRLYVYVAESLLTLLFLHLRLTLPWLFTGFIERYWPLFVMFLAFAGVGLSEFFQRKRTTVLSEPLQRTGIFLPLLPVLGFWALPSQVHYSGLLLTVGFLYGFLSITRRSFGFGLLASLAANGGLWYWLHQQTGYGFLQHPQLWLIPVALSVLAAAYLNREQLSEEQMARVRYLCLMTTYVSSTADMFINGVSSSPWLPLILAGLSVLGVLAGMALRVRSFLYLGTTFLLLALLSMIRLASVNFGWTWLWYVAGILLGLMIITLFALFEKKREDMLRLLDQLRDWER